MIRLASTAVVGAMGVMALVGAMIDVLRYLTADRGSIVLTQELFAQWLDEF